MRVLVVCLGNICRSPAAEAALREALLREGLDDVDVDSAGTGDWHVGHPPDERMVAAGTGAGLLVDGVARTVTPQDLRQADLVLVMDRSNLDAVRALAPDEETRRKVRLFLSFTDGRYGDEVPDPYFGGPDGFDHVVRVVRAGAEAVVAHLRNR